MVPLKGLAFLAWITFGLGSILYAAFATTYERTLIFKEPIPDKALTGYVIRTEQVPDEGSCRVKCYLEPNCVSINVGPATEGQLACDLNDHTDESSSQFALEERKHYIYYAVENLCHGNPCPVSVSVCQVGFTNKGYRCACREGYVPTGDHGQCEDLNECTAQGGNNCSPNADCINKLGSFECRCRAGYIGDGVVCKDPGDCDFDSDGLCNWWTNDTSFHASFQWLLGTGSTSSSSTGPSADHTSGSGKYLYVEASNPAQQGNKARLTSTQFPATAGRCLSFWYHMYGSSTGSLNVYIKDVDYQSNLVWSMSGEQEDKWIQARVSLASSSSYEVVIEAVRGVNFRGDIGLDDISFTDGPCVEEVGCFYDNRNQRAFPTYVRNLRQEIDWYHLEKTIQKCALLSKQRNFQIFAVQFYGECWSGNTSNIHYDRYGVADNSECPFGVGKANVNAVYRILP